MKYPFQEVGATNRMYADALKEAAIRVIDSGRYLNGPETEAFERELASVCNTVSAIATGNGLDALKLIMRGYIELGRLHRGDRLIAAGNTFIATILPAEELGLKVELVDPDERTHSLDLAVLNRHLGEGPGLIAVTHLYGTPTWDEWAAERLRARGWIIIEDAAQAIGAEWHNQRVGSLGDATGISFYPAKNIGALGDAGAVCTSDRELAETVRKLRNYGGREQYRYQYAGYNSRMDEIQAAMLRVKLQDVDNVYARRRAVAEAYSSVIDNPLVHLPTIFDDRRQVWHQYVIRSKYRDLLAQYLLKNGVGTLIHYPIPPHKQDCYAGRFKTPLPITERLANEVLSLPIANITPSEGEEIGKIINRFSI